METVCNECDGTEFTLNAGFYYCDNCGQRATAVQEVEDQADGQFDDIQKKTHRIKQVTKAESKFCFLVSNAVINRRDYSRLNFPNCSNIRCGANNMGSLQLHIIWLCQ